MRILVIEDDAACRRSLELTLSGAGFNVDSTPFGEEGIELARAYDYQAIVLDLGLADLEGHGVLRALRRHQVKAPILVLSAAAELRAKLETFAAGGDDHVSKPWHAEELAARLKAAIRRTEGHADACLRAGELSLDMAARAVEAGGAPVHLTGKEFQLLETLMLRRGKVVSRETLITALYGAMDEASGKIVDVFVCKVRQKLAAACAGRRFIKTVWGGGYMLEEAPAEPVRDAA